jgi:hypothetical protein
MKGKLRFDSEKSYPNCTLGSEDFAELIGGCTNMTKLVYENGAEATGDLEIVTASKALKTLILAPEGKHSVKITNLNLNELNNLEDLCLGKNVAVTADLQINQLSKSLKIFDVYLTGEYGMSISSSALEGLNRLEELYLNGNVTVTDELKKLSKFLKILSIAPEGNGNVSIASSILEELKSLKELYLCHNTTVTGGLRVDQLAESLEILSIKLKGDDKVSIASSTLKQFKNLKELYLYKNVTVDGRLEELVESLKYLGLYGQATVNLPALAKVQDLALGDGVSVPYGVDTLSIKLKSLALCGDEYEVIPGWLSKVHECKKIDISHTAITEWNFSGGPQLPKEIKTIIVNSKSLQLYDDKACSCLKQLSGADSVVCEINGNVATLSFYYPPSQ